MAVAPVTKILYGFSPIGLGHATRAMVLAEELKRRGADVRLFSGGKAADFVRDQGHRVEGIVDDPVPYVSRGEMKRVALWYIRSWLAYKRTLKRTERLFGEYSPDLVVGDEEFTGMEVARRHNKKRVFISDELMLGFGRTWLSRKIEARVERWYRGLQESVDLLIIPDSGTNSGNRRFVGPIVRRRNQDCEKIRSEKGVSQGRTILFSMSGSGIGNELLETVLDAMKDPRLGKVQLLISGNRGRPITKSGVFDLGIVANNQDLIGCADLVISTAGKSTIDEAAASGTPIIAIPIRHHAEQERNAAALGYTADDAKKLRDLIPQKLAIRDAPIRFEGELSAADLILSLS